MRRWLAIAGVIGCMAAPLSWAQSASVALADPAAPPAHTAAGLVRISSPAGLAHTREALLAAFAARGLKVFAVLDHAAGAREYGTEMPPTEVIVFGHPAVGTPLMQAHPDLAFDLPLRVLLRQRADGQVEVLWREHSGLEQWQHLPVGTLARLAPVEKLIRQTLSLLAAPAQASRSD